MGCIVLVKHSQLRRTHIISNISYIARVLFIRPWRLTAGQTLLP